MLNLRAVTHRYGAHAPAIEQVDLDMGPGEVLGLLGPNGAGKTTLLGVIDGRLTPAAGEIDRPAPRTAEGRSAFGYVAEAMPHFEALTGRANAVFFARAAGVPRGAAEAEVRGLMSALGLTDEWERPVSEYSFGARRKLALVEALAHAPVLALLDEPTVGLDAASRSALERLLRRRAADGLSTILASHDLPFVARVADRVLFMVGGHVVDRDRPSRLLAAMGDAVRFEITLAQPHDADVDWPGTVSVVRAGNPLVLEAAHGAGVLPATLASLSAAGAEIRTVNVREPGLGDAFRRATGEELAPATHEYAHEGDPG